MKCYNIFHVSLLELYQASAIEGRQQTLPPPIVIDREEEYWVERILKSKKRKARQGKKLWVEYLVKWEGYPLGEAAWENVDAFQGLVLFLGQFLLENPEASQDPSLSQ